MLTPTELNFLRQDLSGLVNIEYDEVMTELLDHYASLTERKMTADMPFDEASKWAWAELGSGDGLQQIQTDYEKSIKKQVRVRHLEILKSYFRWPAFVTTALVAVLMYFTAPFITANGMFTVFYVCGLSPLAVLFYGHWKHLDQQTNGRKIVWTYLRESGSIIFNLFYVFGINVLNSLFEEKSKIWLFQVHSTVGLILCLLTLLYAVSFIQLFKENFSLKLA
ncbi:hypothetical protein [Spirosoma pollinicola]|uniref:Uncharacterized protein n=1 Tax=Spirosoma pollinicola TaxID=2057025 RepID=A0A2K8Z4D9_9BACT|nr:hypothetical protein [Spirosoma pollinicola]AUD04694.1 hypothetical protein CWM47_24310 [Spirosoma pollinicola]